jgi:hypothetical protein
MDKSPGRGKRRERERKRAETRTIEKSSIYIPCTQVAGFHHK